jgi:hypothetical protein
MTARVRVGLQLGFTLLGIYLGFTLVPACSGESWECHCSQPRPMLQGNFSASPLQFTGDPPASFHQLTPKHVQIGADTVSVEYDVAGQPGTATFSIARKYDLPTQ